MMYLDLTKAPAPVVLAQDAAGAGSAESGTKHGAFCLAISAPPIQEIEDVIKDSRLLGKATALPSLLLGARSQTQTAAHDMPLTLRSSVPRHWCEGKVQWFAILARKWRTAMDISEGETRSIVVWARVLLRAARSRGREFFDVSDNFSAVAVICRGRAQPRHLNAV